MILLLIGAIVLFGLFVRFVCALSAPGDRAMTAVSLVFWLVCVVALPFGTLFVIVRFVKWAWGA